MDNKTGSIILRRKDHSLQLLCRIFRFFGWVIHQRNTAIKMVLMIMQCYYIWINPPTILGGTKMAAAVGDLQKISVTGRGVVNLSHRGLKVVPQGIKELKYVKALHLNDNSIILPPEEIGFLDELEVLTLDHNQLTVLPSGLFECKRLQVLSLGYNRLTCISDDVQKLNHLKELWLPGVQLTTVPKGLFRLKGLQLLSLEGNELDALPEDFGELTGLSWLNLANNKLHELPDSFAELKKLSSLKMDSNNFKEFPIILLSLASLVYLSLSHNLISDFDHVVAGLRESPLLSWLNLQENGLEFEENKSQLLLLEENGKSVLI